jgi:hypothetical protein
MPTLLVQIFHKVGTTLIGTDEPMGEVDIPLLNIKGDGSSTTQWYPLRRFGRLKDVTGDVSLCLFYSQALYRFIYQFVLAHHHLVKPGWMELSALSQRREKV